jgi:hypothetical protein
MLLLGRRQGAAQAAARLLPIRQAGQGIEVGQLDDAVFGAPLARQRNRHLPDLVRMKRLLQIREFLLGRHHAADLARIDVRIGGADDDLDGRIQLANARRGPYPVRARRHAHVEKGHGEGLVGGDGLAHRRDRRFGAGAEHGAKVVSLGFSILATSPGAFLLNSRSRRL